MIPGLSYKRDYLFIRQAKSVLEQIDELPWNTELKRRTQHYGYKYDYTKRRVNMSLDQIAPLPRWADTIALMLSQDSHMRPDANQLIVNEYIPGQGIAAHVDCEPCFGNTVVSISLGGPCIMEFTNRSDPDFERGKTYSLLLEHNSILVLTGPARFWWTHCIPARKIDTWKGQDIQRERRVSLTFRTVLDELYQIDDPLIIDMRAEGGIVRDIQRTGNTTTL